MSNDETKIAYLVDVDGIYLFDRNIPIESTEREWLIFTKPPSLVEGYVSVYDRTKEEWSQVEDYRGVLLYNTETKIKFYKDSVGGLKGDECVYSAEMEL